MLLSAAATGLRGAADAAVLDHPVASLRLHDDQRRAAGLRRGRHLGRAGATRAAAALRRRSSPAAPRCSASPRSRASRSRSGSPFNPLEILWDPRQPLRLLAVYVLLLRAVLLRRDLRLPDVHPVRRAAAPHLQLRHPRRGSGQPRRSWPRCSCSPPTDALKLARRARDRGGGAGARSAAARGSDRLAAALLAAAIAARSSCPRTGSACVPSEYKELSQTLRIDGTRIVAEASSARWAWSRVVESAHVPFRHAPGMSLAATMEPPPQLARVHRRRRPQRADPLRRPARAARLSRPAHVGAAVPPARAAARAGARRRRRSRRAAGDLPRRAQRSTRSSSIRRSSISCERRFADFSGAALQRARRARPRRRGARLRRRAPRALRPDPGGAARRVRRVVGGALRALGELPVHGRGAAGLPAAPRAGRHAGDHALGRPAAARHRSSSSPPRSSRSSATACRAGAAAGADPRLEDRDAAREERRVRRAADIAALREFCRARSFDVAYFPGIDARRRPTATTCSTGRTSTTARVGAARPRPRRRSSSATSSTSRRRPTTGRTSSTSSSGARCPSCWR